MTNAVFDGKAISEAKGVCGFNKGIRLPHSVEAAGAVFWGLGVWGAGLSLFWGGKPSPSNKMGNHSLS